MDNEIEELKAEVIRLEKWERIYFWSYIVFLIIACFFNSLSMAIIALFLLGFADDRQIRQTLVQHVIYLRLLEKRIKENE